MTNHYHIGAVDAATAQMYRDTNELFWKQTGYKVGLKLNPNLAADKPYVKIWMAIYAKVRAKQSLPVTKPDMLATEVKQLVEQAAQSSKAGDATTAATQTKLADAKSAQFVKEISEPFEKVVDTIKTLVPNLGFNPFINRAWTGVVPSSKSDYAKIADGVAIETPGNFLLVTVEDNGHARTFNNFASSQDAKQTYDTFSRDKYALVAWYDRTPGTSNVPSGLMDYFVRKPRVVTVTTSPPADSMLLPMLGLGVAGLMGIVVAKGKKRKA